MKIKKKIKIYLLLFLNFVILTSSVNNVILASVMNPLSYSVNTTNDAIVKLDTTSKNTKNKGKYIIKLKDNISENDKNDYLKKIGLSDSKIESNSTGRVLTNDLNDKVDTKYVDKIEEDSTTEVQTININDPSFPDQWYLKGIEYNTMLENPNSDNLIVAVIDSGVCNNHPDLLGKVLAGWNFIDNNSDTTDNLGHGCMVSGIIAANTNNSIGISGGSLNTTILPLKVIGNDGTGSYSALIDAIDFAVSKNVDIINISLGGYFDSGILHDSIQKAVNNGITVVASAGNTGNDEVMYPAKYSEVVSVGSVDNDYTISKFSSTSQDIKLWAYGNSILTTNKEGSYITASGTSLASALVTSFIAEGGKYSFQKTINYSNSEIKPVFLNDYTLEEEPTSQLSLNIPKNLQIVKTKNDFASGVVVDWQMYIRISNTEKMIVSIWNREDKLEMNNIIDEVKKTSECTEDKTKDSCIANYPHKSGEFSYYYLYKRSNKSFIRITYIFDSLVGKNTFQVIANSIKINQESLLKKSDFYQIDKIRPDLNLKPQTNTCGGVYDPSVDAYCCANDANCVWWAYHMRHDLIGKVWGDAGSSWINSANQSGVPVSSIPSIGAIAVWDGHVAYVKNIISSTQIEISEMNCNNYQVPFRNSAIVNNGSYGNMSLLGYIPLGNECSGNNPILYNWNKNNALSCYASGSATIRPESSIVAPAVGDIIINVN